ncbi:MAG: LysR family transcriptional regulator [Tardiphaga sp.]|jgi:DNA-binding transcriptional LysR family regulator|uniref:LysR family transcriptional regulator n=1 Tax=Tardiphaga sp. TaxID=1926292 RepID=UPI0026261935|nr:LysR family transcriptional regulator [Tardiphaga sp.]MDB5500890.1 LysR family transcriptional regulator [Tardiphaga sp.]
MLHAAALNYFREVARIGSIRKAAGSLNVAASALNRQIINLEIQLGTPLFDRLPGGMRLTVAGELLLRHVVDTLHDFDRVRVAIDDLKAARSGHIAIAALDSLLVDFLPRAIDRFRVDFPAVTYSVMTAQPPEVPSMVANGDIDMGFTFVGQIPHSVRYMTEISAPIGIVMRADHPLANKLSVDFDEVSRYPVLTQSGPLPKGADSDAAFATFKSGLKPKLQSNSIQMLKLAIMLNMGVSLFTRLGFLHEIEKGDIAWRPLNSSGVNTIRIGLVVSAQRDLAPPAEQFARRLVEDLHRFAAV